MDGQVFAIWGAAVSRSHKRSIDKVLPIANSLLNNLHPFCERIEIAGSLRRGKPLIGDIEILAIPKRHINLFGEIDAKAPSLLDNHLCRLVDEDSIFHLPRRRWGSKMKSFSFIGTAGGKYHVDLFIQSPETWGVNMMIRTGSAEFSKKMVTHRSKGGWLPDNMRFAGGRLWRGGEVLETPEEKTVFEKCGMLWVPPSEREI